MNYIDYNSKKIPIIGEYDTVIIGGGVAGSSVGISASRNNNKVIIIEKSIFLGGASVNALVNPIMESFVLHNENFYLIEQELKKLGVTTRDGITEYLYSTPENKSFVLEKLFNGDILYDSVLVDASVKDRKIDYVIVCNVEGLVAIKGKQFVDATGDAYLSRVANVQTVSGDQNGNNQMGSLRFEMGGIDINRFRDYCLSLNDDFSKLVKGDFFEAAMVKGKGFKLEPIFQKGVEKGILKKEDLIYFQCFSIPDAKGCMTFNCPHLDNMKKNTNSISRTKAILLGKEKINRLVSFLKEMMPGFKNSYLIRIANSLGIRESYRIVGKYILNEDDYIQRRKFSDAVAKADWYIDVHSTNGLIHMEKYQKGEYYEIPYRALINNQVDNLVTVGRCISTTFLVQASIRVQATLIDMGDTVGKICVKALREKKQLSEYEYKEENKL